MVKVNLSGKDHTMAKVIMENHSTLDNCSSVKELKETLENLFATNSLDTPATRRLLINVGKNRNFAGALQTVYNSFLCGSGMAVI